MEVRRLREGDEAVAARLATSTPQTRLLGDERTIFLVAFDDEGAPMGFVFGYELLRRHGDPSILFVYEVEVDAAYRRHPDNSPRRDPNTLTVAPMSRAARS
jgi:hypothetical protein